MIARMTALDTEGQQVHLLAFMFMLLEQAHPHDARPKKYQEIKKFIGSACEAIGIFREDSRRGPVVWEAGALQTGTLKSEKNTRRHRIGRMFKRALTHTARNAIGKGSVSPKQILIGMAALNETRGPTELLNEQQRKTQKRDSRHTYCEELQS